MLSGALQRNAKHEARLSNISVYFCANVAGNDPRLKPGLADFVRCVALRFAQNDIDQITNEGGRRGYR